MNFEIRKAQLSDDLDLLGNLINSVYKDAEKGMWKDSFKRVSQEELRMLVADSKISLALIDSKIVASILSSKINSESYELGMLVCDPNHRHKGIGKKLINYVEREAKIDGAIFMRLQILHPKNWHQETKEILKEWYPSLGYILKDSINADSELGDLLLDLSSEMLMSNYEKEL